MANQDADSLFALLNSRVEDLEGVAILQSEAGSAESAESIFRACVLLAVSSLDAFVHEKSVEVYLDRIATTPAALPSIASYLRVSTSDLQSATAASLIRYKLSFKTLVSPDKIDEAIDASGSQSSTVWKDIGIATGARESRLRNALDLQVDRRNQIAHEGDWDPVDVALRHISVSHSQDCRRCIKAVVEGLGTHWS
ncbi:HEPN domain-containing protein [Streptomyces sp. NPDC049910]|uniref:HEPN domain-containing protein n=1 Tax=Streptomyces sp. NPDC049910 TaxID=3155278 RepID=UPI003434E504